MIIGFGDTLRNLRLSKGLSQGQLAKKIEISTSMIGLYENGSRMPSYEVLIRIARIFSVTIDYLLGVDGKTEAPFNLDELTPGQAQSVFTVIDEYKKANRRD